MKFVVVGAGVVGKSLSQKLSLLGHNVVLIDNDSKRLEEAAETAKVSTLFGSGASPETLVAAGLEDADYLLGVSDIDEVNIASCFVARLLTPKPKRIARVRYFDLTSPEISSEFLSEYFDYVINPEQAASDYLVRTLRIPGAHEVIEFGNGGIRVLGLTVGANAPIANMKLSALKDWPQQLPVLVVAVMRGSKLLVPKGDDKIRAGDVIYAVTLPAKTKLLFELAGKHLQETRRVVLSVNDRLSFTLIKTLLPEVDSLQVIVDSVDLKQALERRFRKIKVIRANASDQADLIEVGVPDCDSFIAATNDDENNVLAALLAKRLGAKTVGSFINNQSYGPLVAAVGVEMVINLRLAAASAIFQHIHHRSIVTELSLQNEGAGFVEILCEEKMPFLNKPLKDLGLPHGLLVAAIERGQDMIIPTGDERILAGDKVVFFLLRGAQQKLEKILGFKLELFV